MLKLLATSVLTGVVIWLIPAPGGISREAWRLLAIFLATIIGIIMEPLPLGAVALLGLGAAVLTKTLTFIAAFSAFGDPIPWLIVLGFFFARGFIKMGLGKETERSTMKIIKERNRVIKDRGMKRQRKEIEKLTD